MLSPGGARLPMEDRRAHRRTPKAAGLFVPDTLPADIEGAVEPL